MNITEFENHLDRYGANIDNWPKELSKAGLLLINSDSKDARKLHESAKHMEKILDGFKQLPASDGLKKSILNRIRFQSPATLDNRLSDYFAQWIMGAVWRPTLCAIVPLVLGFSAGLSNIGESIDNGQNDLNETVALLAFADFMSTEEDSEIP